MFSLSTTLPEALQSLAGAFVRRFKPDLHGTLVTDALSEDAQNLECGSSAQTSLDEETASLLSQWKSRNSNLSTFQTPSKVTYRRRARQNGSDLKPGNVSFPDSLIIVGTEEVWSAAQIESIFDIESWPKGEREVYTLLKVRYFEEMVAEDIQNDVYRRFNGMGRVVYVGGGGCKKEVVPISSAISHFAMTEAMLPRIGRNHAHVLPLFRVGGVGISASTLC